MMELATTIAMTMLGLGMVFAILRVILGPSLADRILGLDTATTLGIGIIAVFAVRVGLYLYHRYCRRPWRWSVRLSTAAFARYLLSRGRAT